MPAGTLLLFLCNLHVYIKAPTGGVTSQLLCLPLTHEIWCNAWIGDFFASG